MPSPLPRHSGWAYYFAHFPSRISLPRKGCRVGLRIVLFEACSAFTRVTACTLALSPIRDTLIEGFSHFVTSMTAPIASGRSVGRVGFAPTGKAPPCHGAHPSRTLDIGAGRDLRRRKFFDIDQGRSVLYDDDVQKLFVQVMVFKRIV